MKQVSTLKYLTAACLGASLLAPSAYALDKNFKLNGFMRVGTIQTNAESDLAELNSVGGKNYPNVDSLTTVGLQTTYTMDEKDSFVVQVVGRGLEKFDTGLEWAYVTHQFTRAFSATVGRTRTPFFMLSESQEVGFSYPMVYLPNEMYRLFATTMEGGYTKYRFNLGNWYGEGRVGIGTVDNKVGQQGSTVGFNINNGRYFTFALGGENVTYYTSFVRGKFHVDVLPGSTLEKLDGVFAQYGADDASLATDFFSTYKDFGVSWDPGGWYVLGELGQLSFGKGFFDDKSSGYLLVGYHFGKWLPYAMFTKAYTQSEGDQRRRDALAALGRKAEALGGGAFLTHNPPTCPANPGDSSATIGAVSAQLDPAISRVCSYQMQQTTYGLGVRYDINPRLTGKFELSYATDLGGTYGTFYYPLGRDNATIVALSLDGVF